MLLLLRTVGLLSVLLCTTAVHADDKLDAVLFDDSRIETKEIPSWFKHSFLDLREDLAEAAEAGKQGLMLYFDTQGCAYCKAFIKHTLNEPDIQADLSTHFDVVDVDMFSDVEVTDFAGRVLPAGDFAIREGATVSPTLVFYDTDGSLLFRIVGYQPPKAFRTSLDYVVGGHYASQSFRQFASRARARPAPDAVEPVKDPLFGGAPYMLDRRTLAAERPLLVLFEESGCEECLQLQSEVFAYGPVRELLARYDAVRMDWSDAESRLVTPSGERSSPVEWAKHLGVLRVPALVFFDEAGQEVFRLESLILRQRMERALLYVLDKAYARGMTYQQFTREKTNEKLKAAKASETGGE